VAFQPTRGAGPVGGVALPIRAAVLLLLGLCVTTGAAISDVYLHRGLETGREQVAVTHPTGRELATNVDLTVFPPEQIDDIAAMLQSSHFRTVRQTFSWRSIEPVRGTYDWGRYDAIVNGLRARGIEVVAVLAGSPEWARSPEQVGYEDAPPARSADFATFAAALVDHFDGGIRFVQMWDGPNLPERWGGVPATAETYLPILADAANAVRGADSGAKVVLAEFAAAPTPALPNDDLRIVERLYELGGARFFDVVALQLDGGSSPPYDRQVSGRSSSFSRAILMRELMLRYGDRDKAVWLTRYGWAVSEQSGIDEAERADFTVAGMERARSEWPWLGLMQIGPSSGKTEAPRLRSPHWSSLGSGMHLPWHQPALSQWIRRRSATARTGQISISPRRR
jgi:hypothetical protein